MLWPFPFTAPYVEFTKPLQDVEVREKESAKFECEVSRESAKVSSAGCKQSLLSCQSD